MKENLEAHGYGTVKMQQYREMKLLLAKLLLESRCVEENAFH